MIKFILNALSKGLSFSKSESKGVLVLIILVLVALAVPKLVFNELKGNQVNAGVETKDLKAWVAAVKTSYTEKQKVKPTTFPRSSPSYVKEKQAKFKKTETVTEKLIIYDLNGASPQQFQEVKGIGPVYAQRIEKYRELLGGFTSMDQLQEVYGLDTILLEKLNKRFEIRSDVRPIPINADSAKTLASHPYLSYDLAWIIINYRAQNGDIRSSEDLANIKAIDDSLFQKLKPYID